MVKLCALFPIIFSLGLLGPSAVLAFDDDSTIDLRFFDKGRCKNGKNINEDSGNSKFACDFTEAFVDSRDYLYKNDKRVSSNKVIEFKLTRNAKLYYRKKIDAERFDRKKGLTSAKLYDEKGLLNSGAGGVIFYLVSSGGVVYLNENYEIFKNPIISGPNKYDYFESSRTKTRILSVKNLFVRYVYTRKSSR